MGSSQQLKQLLSPDLPSLGAYYRDMSTSLGAGVLVVNYYPRGEVAQMSAGFLRPNQIPRLARQMGLPTLQVEFERHNQQDQMLVALIAAEIKGVVTVELHELELQTAPALSPHPKVKLLLHLHQSANLLLNQQGSGKTRKISHKPK